MMTVLFSSAGRRVGLIECFRKAARSLGVSAEFVAIDMDPEWSPACQVADHAVKVGRCTSDAYISEVMDVCDRHKVSLIVPTIDTELLTYAEHRRLFADAGIEIHLGSADFVRVARDKESTHHVLGRNGVPVPQTWLPGDLTKDLRSMHLPFPLIVKPKDGSASKGIRSVSSVEQLRAQIEGKDGYLVQEICTGQEYTVNCFYDRRGICVACVPHVRRFVRDGEVCFAQTERVPEFTAIAHSLSHIFPGGIWGCICFQAFREADGGVKVSEINARFGGGYPICDTAGGTFAKWILQDLAGQTPDYNDDWKEGIRMLRYDAAFYTLGGARLDTDCPGY